MDYKKRGDIFDKIFGDINIKKTHSIDDHFSNLGKTNSAISNIENHLLKLDAAGAQLLSSNSPIYPHLLQAKQSMLKKLIDGMTKRAEISSIIGLEHKDFEKKNLAKDNLREVNNELVGQLEQAKKNKENAERNHQSLINYYIDDNENSIFEQKIMAQSEKNLKEATEKYENLCESLREDKIDKDVHLATQKSSYTKKISINPQGSEVAKKDFVSREEYDKKHIEESAKIVEKHEGHFRFGHETNHPMLQGKYAKGVSVVYDDARPNGDPAKHIIDFDYDPENKCHYFLGVDKNGNRVKCKGFITIGNGSRLFPIFEKRTRPYKPKSKDNVFVEIAGKKVRFVDALGEGIIEQKVSAELAQKLEDSRKKLMKTLGENKNGEKRFYKLGVKATANGADIIYNAGDLKNYPNTCRLIIQLADNPELRNDVKWRQKFMIEVLEICKSNGVFNNGLFTRRLANVEGILGGRLEQGDIDYINSNLPSRIKDLKSFNLSFNTKKNVYVVESELVKKNKQ